MSRMSGGVLARALIAMPLTIMLLGVSAPARSGEVDISYTLLDPEGGCQWDSLDHLSEEEQEQMMGNSAVCDGLAGYPVHFSEYDLRQFVAFGPVGPDDRTPGGFAQFNRTGERVEWRLRNGRPYATILRWFIENMNDDGLPDAKSLGQVLVVSTVAQPGSPRSCPVGYVDARANSDANEIARRVADGIAPGFRCGVDQPVYHGNVGRYAGSPNDIAR